MIPGCRGERQESTIHVFAPLLRFILVHTFDTKLLSLAVARSSFSEVFDDSSLSTTTFVTTVLSLNEFDSEEE